jgi:hypothetical protein
VAVGGIVVIAVLTRLPNLFAIPAFTDEVEEVALGLDILRHGLRPLTNVDPYIGPLWNYLLAGALWLAGPSAGVPRAVMLVAGTLTVLLTYVLGRTLHGRRVGLLAATLLATSAVHTAVNSHVAWSNCVTPLFTTAGLLLLARALRADRPRLLVPTGLLFGIAFHTHPTALPVLVGGALAVLVQRRGWLVGPWPYLAAALAIASNANLIVYNLQTAGRTFSYAAEVQDSYVRETGESASYADRLGDLLLGLVRAIGGLLDRHATLLDYTREPLLWIAGGLTLLGLLLALRHRSWLPVLVVASTIVILPLVNPKYDPILNGRYLATILPLCLIWVGLALEWLAWRRSPFGLTRAANATIGRAGARLAGAAGVGVAAVLATALVVGSLGSLARYYDDVRENARTGERILEVVQTAKSSGQRAQPVVLDQRLDKVALGPGAGIILRVLRTTLELEGVEVQELWLGEQRPAEVREGQFVVLASRSKPQFTQEAVTGLGLRDWRGGAARVQSQASLYGLYRFGPGPLSADGAKTGARPKPVSTPARATPSTSAGASAGADAASRRR